MDICQLRASLFAQILYSHQGREIVSDYLDHLPDALCKPSCPDRACTNALKNVDAKGNTSLDLSGPLMLVPCSPHESVEFLDLCIMCPVIIPAQSCTMPPWGRTQSFVRTSPDQICRIREDIWSVELQHVSESTRTRQPKGWVQLTSNMPRPLHNRNSLQQTCGPFINNAKL